MPKQTPQIKKNEERELVEELVELKRTSQKTKGGNRFRFTALMVVGDGNGRVGYGVGRAKDVTAAIKKGVRKARKSMQDIQLVGEAQTIAHDIRLKHKAAHILLKPAPSGTGVRAGGVIRTIAEAAGIKNIVGKIMRTDNPKSNLVATFMALEEIKDVSERKTGKAKKTKTKVIKAKKTRTQTKKSA